MLWDDSDTIGVIGFTSLLMLAFGLAALWHWAMFFVTLGSAGVIVSALAARAVYARRRPQRPNREE